MKFNSKRWIAIISLCALVTLAVCFFIKPAPVRLIASGQLQDGRDYTAACEMSALAAFPGWSAKSYSIHSLDLTIDGKARAVPANGLDGIAVHDPKKARW